MGAVRANAAGSDFDQILLSATLVCSAYSQFGLVKGKTP
jgi:hypothetical protein